MFRRPRRTDVMTQMRTGTAQTDPLLGMLFDESVVGMLAIDRQGLIVRASHALRRMLRDAVDLTPGQPAGAVFALATRAEIWGQVEAILAGRVHTPLGFTAPLAVHEPDGEQVVADVFVRPLREEGGTPGGAILRIADITHQRLLEVQVAHSQKLQAVGQLAGGIAHDFNNLLTAILGAADSILHRPGIDTETAEDAGHISASVGRGAALVRQMLAFGRQQALQPRPVAVNEAISEFALLLRRLLGTAIRLDLDLETPGRAVRVDPVQLDQVLLNLAVNARDAMPEGGTLTLRGGHITLYRPLTRGPETIPPGRYVMIEVCDTGGGIPPEVLPRIFDPFFTTRRDRGGTGLGLSTVHGIIRQSDGFIAVESRVGEGTRVRVYLPRWDGEEAMLIPTAPAAPDTAAAEPSGPPPAGRRAVLLVEDEEPGRRLAERGLAARGWTVLAAADGQAALALLAGADVPPLAAVITDMVMPGIDGLALVRAVRERLRLPGLPAILVSGYTAEALHHDFAAESVRFLAKPYTLRDLAAAVGEMAAAV